MVVGAKVCELTDGFLWFVCGLYVGIMMSPNIEPIIKGEDGGASQVLPLQKGWQKQVLDTNRL